MRSLPSVIVATLVLTASMPLSAQDVLPRTAISEISIGCKRFQIRLTPQATVTGVVSPAGVIGEDDGEAASREARPLLTLELQRSVFGLQDGKRRRLTLDSVARADDTLVFSHTKEPAVRVVFQATDKQDYVTLRLVKVETPRGEHATRLEFKGAEGLRTFALNAEATQLKGSNTVVFQSLLPRGAEAKLGAVALWYPETEQVDDEILYQVWVDENLPHPAIDGEWTVPRAKQWVADYIDRFRNYSEIYITGQNLDELKRCVDYASEMKIANVYMHLMTWAGRYWPEGEDIYQVNPQLFPGGQADFKELCEYAKSKGVGVGIRTLSNGISLNSQEYLGGTSERRLAHFWRGTLVNEIGADADSIVIKSDRTLPTSFVADQFKGKVEKPSIRFALIDDEIVQYSGFDEHADGSITLKVARDRGRKLARGYGPTNAARHEAGAPVKILTGHFRDHVTPDHDSPLFDVIAQRYADFNNRMGLATSSYDGLYLYHFHTGYGASKLPGEVYRRLDHPTWPTTSNVPPRWGYFELDFHSVRKALGLDKTTRIPQRMTIMLGLHQDHWPAPSPYGHTYAIVPNAVAGFLWCSLQEQSSTHEFTADTLKNFGLREHFATAIQRWRKHGPALPDAVKERIFNAYDGSARYPLQVEHFRFEETDGGLDVVPFRPMRRAVGDRGWGYIQEHGPVYTYQYLRPNTRGLRQVENPYHQQTPEFIIRVMKDFRRDILTGYSDRKKGGSERFYKLLNQTLGSVTWPAADAAEHATGDQVNHRLMLPLDAFDRGKRKPQVDSGEMQLELTLDGARITYDNQSRQARTFDLDDKQKNSVVTWNVSSSIQNAKGLGIVITGDGSNALFVIRLRGRGARDFVIPIDFTGKRYIEIPDPQVSWSDARWPITSAWKRWQGHAISSVLAGFVSVPPGTKASVFIEDIQLLPELNSALTNPVIHCGNGTIAIEGVIPSDRYLWYRGGDKVEVYDLNWNSVAELPVTLSDAGVPSGRSDISIRNHNEAGDPWLECQFFVRDNPVHCITRN